ncbi:AAA family ATPase [Gluconobacter wancherniae]|uniref:AAA family ATPase n=1 Tax=Gluconobacter wancherniae TaxID=1307955 RepID=UPI001B8B5128|nr:AAA family ATPase [Gluconobacter wancherniae]MBS1061605.1 AAA family ATPase [Gluconobacter wancherniae]
MSSRKTTISRLSIGGFKSFADEVRLDILPGLTGIIGPNGCGKSNVVEALRWAMGETSARALRGGELDDLIFAGTNARPARNLAQVTLHLTDAAGLAPAPFQDSEELEVSRRAERGSGSDYRINGRSTRARDVQTLFADLASGARSSAIVSQNRVGQLINAKPEERRLLLEEAAGITGLHARRHDAELKLRQTENNLARAEDLRLQLEERLVSLESQSVQARAYRELSNRLREAETQLHSLLHARANAAVNQGITDLAKARQRLKEAEAAAEKATIADFEARQATPKAREEADRLRMALERLTVQTETAKTDLDRARQGHADAQARLQQVQEDFQRSSSTLEHLRATQAETATELENATTEQVALPDSLNQLRESISDLTQRLKLASATLEQATRERDAEAVRRDGLTSAFDTLSIRLSAEFSAVSALRAELDTLERNCPDEKTLHQAETEADLANIHLDKARSALSQVETDLQNSRLSMELEVRALAEGESRLVEIQAQENDLKARLENLQERFRQSNEARQQTASALLPIEKRRALENDLLRLKENLAHAAAEESRLRDEQDALGNAWLEARAAAEESAQRQQALTREHQSALQLVQNLKPQLAQARQALETARAALIPTIEFQKAGDEAEQLEHELSAIQNTLTDTETALSAANQKADATRAALSDLESRHIRATGECEGLEQSLAAANTQPDALEDHLSFPDDLARAVASALADGLDASLAPDAIPADRRWKHLADLPETAFSGGISLATLIDAPPALRRCLGSIFLLEDETDGPSLQKNLTKGQALVGKSGALWRWDGFIRNPNAPDAGAARLEQRRKLAAAKAVLLESETLLPAARQAALSALNERTACENLLKEQRAKRGQAEPQLANARSRVADIERRAALSRGIFEQAERRVTESENALQEADTRLNTAQQALSSLPDPATFTQEAEKRAKAAQDARSAVSKASEHHQNVHAQHDESARHLDQAVVRHESAAIRLSELDAALARTKEETEELSGRLLDILHSTSRPDIPALMEKSKVAQERYEVLGNDTQRASDCLSKAIAQADGRREALQALNHLIATSQARRETLLPRLATHEELLRQLQHQHTQAEANILARPDDALLEQSVLSATETVENLRETLEKNQSEASEMALGEVRIAGQVSALTARLADLEQQISAANLTHTELTARRGILRHEHEKASTEPEHFEEILAQREKALTDLRDEYVIAREQDEAAEKAGAETQKICREAEQALATAREAIATLTERADQAKAARDRLLSESEPPRGGEIPSDLSDQAESSLRRRISKMTRERDDLGAVNLRADIEYQEARETAETIAREHAELTAAISRLRGAIGSINKEGRERLVAVFTEVDRHFQSLFARMFGGGRAHLGMVGSDDPLEAGLEIFAQPPGKKLSTLSLLSGGEQALTALSLIFATFRCNPAPICVLDEVDAPLDDANVERFCSLLADMTKEAGTRFLVVTHHQLTMAHMDRLFGVTMQERGVSRILSVDLGRATQMTGG